ncbi:MAG: hypothetical protein EOO75_07355 [Myxococcales bacterium]|nr:MAG: hypothetical protein EOO75_07355 [Myxococcales bacterium]
MNAWGERYERAMRCALRREAPDDGRASPGERDLLALIQPTFHAPLAVELVDLGETHELAAALIGEATSFAFEVASGRADAALPPPPAWHRGQLWPRALVDLRSRLDALVATDWPPLGQGRDGIGITLWLRDHRGPQRLDWSTATHDPAGAPGALARALLTRAAEVAPALSAPASAAWWYLWGQGAGCRVE